MSSKEICRSFEIDDDESKKDKEDSLLQLIEPDKPLKNIILAIALYILNVLCSSGMYVTCKLGYYYDERLGAFDYLLIRSSAMIFGAIFPMVWNKVSILIKREHLFSFIGIQLIAFLSMITHYIALKYLPIVKDSLLFNLLPIFFTIFGVMLLHEKVQRNEVVWMIGAFVGVIVMISNKTDSDMDSSFTMQLVSSIMVIFSCATCALIGLYLRIFNQTNSPLLYPFYYAVTLSVFGIGFYFIHPSSYNPDCYSFNIVCLFLISGVFNIVANILSGYALKLAEISILAPFGYIGPVLMLINDVFVFNYVFGITDILGALIVLICLFMKLRAVEHNKKQTTVIKETEEDED